MELSTRRRRALSTGLALLLAAESVSAVAAAASASVARRSHAASAVPAVATTIEVVTAPSGAILAASSASDRARVPDAGLADRPEPPSAIAVAPFGPVAKPARPDAPQLPARRAAVTRAAGTTTSAPYSGRNHVWIPALRINRSVAAFPCDRSRPPDNLVYRWGCAGTNNVYLFGHAYSVFKPLHDAYATHRLKVGLKAYYADGTGTVRVFAVEWWKVTLPTPDARWAWAAQPTPSMTLQTCVGADGEYRLMVRLLEVTG